MRQKFIIKISGMHCRSCSGKIKRALEKKNIEVQKISYEEGVLICYGKELGDILSKLAEMGYHGEAFAAAEKKSGYTKKLMIGIIIFLGVFLILKSTTAFNYSSALQGSVGYPLLFALGIVTSIHCLSMCGGIVLTQSIASKNPVKSTLLYNIGRVAAYTALGGMIGGIGSVVSFSPFIKNLIMIFAGGFMVLLGLSMLESFRFLKPYIKLPRLFRLKGFKHSSKTPLLIGLGTGFMPCGPLQTVQLYALGTGSMVTGALSMFVFSLGTVPLMLGLGSISAFISRGLNQRIVKLSGVLVILLGLVMVSQGLSAPKGGVTAMESSDNPDVLRLPQVINESQFITTIIENNQFQQNRFILESGRPVKWMVNVKAPMDCSDGMIISNLGVEQDLVEGHNLIEFTPTAEGDIEFSCKAGVLTGQFTVIKDLEAVPEDLEYLPFESLDCCTE
jgi:uncharacterized protein